MKIDSLYEKPVLFALAAVVVISVGTLVTTFIPSSSRRPSRSAP